MMSSSFDIDVVVEATLKVVAVVLVLVVVVVVAIVIVFVVIAFIASQISLQISLIWNCITGLTEYAILFASQEITGSCCRQGNHART